MARRSNNRSHSRSYNRAYRSSPAADLLRAIVIALFIISLGVVLILYFRPLYYLDISLPNFHLDTALGLDAAYRAKLPTRAVQLSSVLSGTGAPLPLFRTLPRASRARKSSICGCKRIFDVVQTVCAPHVTGVYLP